MKSWRRQLSFVGLATLTLAMLVHGCESPEPFHLGDDAATTPDSGGENPGSGGFSATGGRAPTGTTGTGGRSPSGAGGRAVGGSTPAGGPGSGGITGAGGMSTGSGGRAFPGGSGGVGGRAVSGSGGASGFAGRAGTGAVGGRAASGGVGGRTTGVGGRAGTGGRAATGGAGGRGGRSGAGGRGATGMSGANCITDIQTNSYAAGTAPPCSACNDNGKSLQTQCEAVIDCIAPQWPCTGNCLTQCYNMSGASGPVMSCVSALTTASCGS